MSIASTSSEMEDQVLSFSEQSELALTDFIRHLVLFEGKYGKEETYFMPEDRPQNWSNLEHLMNEFERRSDIKLEVEDLGEYLDLPSYIQIVKDYIRLYSPQNERKRNLVAIISLMVFGRIYARRLKEKSQLIANNEQYLQRDLDRLTTYTVYVIKNLLQSGLQIGWDQFCQELESYGIVGQAIPSDLKIVLLGTSTICGVLAICWFVYRSHLSARP